MDLYNYNYKFIMVMHAYVFWKKSAMFKKIVVVDLIWK
jgi:hypothetical protein